MASIYKGAKRSAVAVKLLPQMETFLIQKPSVPETPQEAESSFALRHIRRHNRNSAALPVQVRVYPRKQFLINGPDLRYQVTRQWKVTMSSPSIKVAPRVVWTLSKVQSELVHAVRIN